MGALTGVCDHKYCLSCIQKWSKITNLCPQCKRRFNHIDRMVLQDGKMRRRGRRIRCRRIDQGSSSPPPPVASSSSSSLSSSPLIQLTHLLLPNQFSQFFMNDFLGRNRRRFGGGSSSSSSSNDDGNRVDGAGTSLDPFVLVEDEDVVVVLDDDNDDDDEIVSTKVDDDGVITIE